MIESAAPASVESTRLFIGINPTVTRAWRAPIFNPTSHPAAPSISENLGRYHWHRERTTRFSHANYFIQIRGKEGKGDLCLILGGGLQSRPLRPPQADLTAAEPFARRAAAGGKPGGHPCATSGQVAPFASRSSDGSSRQTKQDSQKILRTNLNSGRAEKHGDARPPPKPPFPGTILP